MEAERNLNYHNRWGSMRFLVAIVAKLLAYMIPNRDDDSVFQESWLIGSRRSSSMTTTLCGGSAAHHLKAQGTVCGKLTECSRSLSGLATQPTRAAPEASTLTF
jgi:hypothetical protein